MSEERELSRNEWTRRKFMGFGVLGLLGGAVWGVQKWITEAPKVDGAPAPLRSALEFNEGVNRTLRSDAQLVQEYPKEMAAQRVRVNGNYGVASAMEPSTWALTVNTNRAGADAVLTITLDQIKALPRTEVIFDFKCIEGWSQISHWGGVRFSDFAQHFLVGTKSGRAPSNDRPDDLYTYMSLRTPDGAYYVGIDMVSALHPQTILAYEMNGAPLPLNQGAPLRLIIPTKYGVKNLKRIGTMGFSDERPPDYWHEHGYDYDCAL
jgi:DMSO/TMAO reductase YedYZ molybdopterin-dependent catalytic subunit